MSKSKAYGYYKAKSDCMKTILKTIQSKPVNKNILYYFAMSEFGFEKKVVDNMLETMKEAELIVEGKDGFLNVL